MPNLKEEEERSPISSLEDSNAETENGLEFQPIKATPTNTPMSKENTRASLTISLMRTRSTNGFGCDDPDNTWDGSGGDIEDQRADEKDPFEVRFDGGDSDPMCPRSMAHGRKWLVYLCVIDVYTSTYAPAGERIQLLKGSCNPRAFHVYPWSWSRTMLLGPLSEFFGRRPIYICSFTFFLIWLIPSAVAPKHTDFDNNKILSMVFPEALFFQLQENYIRLIKQREQVTGDIETLLVFTGIFTFLVDAYPLYAASSLAANSFIRSTFGAIFPLFGIQMYHKLGDQWATSLLAFLTVIMMPFPYIFFKYGKQIRGRSRFATA
ncbi:hypothetical protein DID88_004407 [Monilinia fructigena]|uniref:Major facilitator superfamily (MFS) profile domain-containing protein n=1 Tax=Monilinia fructigena TaxID=38457 RepID=A0A395IQI6_9HELO|nr:hypothetical protein DID88_004407 [Monilinia fructigena]